MEQVHLTWFYFRWRFASTLSSWIDYIHSRVHIEFSGYCSRYVWTQPGITHVIFFDLVFSCNCISLIAIHCLLLRYRNELVASSFGSWLPLLLWTFCLLKCFCFSRWRSGNSLLNLGFKYLCWWCLIWAKSSIHPLNTILLRFCFGINRSSLARRCMSSCQHLSSSIMLSFYFLFKFVCNLNFELLRSFHFFNKFDLLSFLFGIGDCKFLLVNSILTSIKHLELLFSNFYWLSVLNINISGNNRWLKCKTRKVGFFHFCNWWQSLIPVLIYHLIQHLLSKFIIAHFLYVVVCIFVLYVCYHIFHFCLVHLLLRARAIGICDSTANFTSWLCSWQALILSERNTLPIYRCHLPWRYWYLAGAERSHTLLHL